MRFHKNAMHMLNLAQERTFLSATDTSVVSGERRANTVGEITDAAKLFLSISCLTSAVVISEHAIASLGYLQKTKSDLASENKYSLHVVVCQTCGHGTNVNS